MSRQRNFLAQLDNFQHEAYLAAQYLYSDMAIQHAASKSRTLYNRLNLTPRFWNTHSAACQVAAYLCIARVFDRSSPFNIDALLDSFEADLDKFSRSALADRKRDGKKEDPAWLQQYLESAYFPTKKDVDRLRKKVLEYREIYSRAIEPARHKYIAHRVKVKHEEVQALFAGGRVSEIWRLVTFLYALYNALWQQYHNARKPVLQPLRYSVKRIYDTDNQQSSPHEAMVRETKKLMQFLENATLDTPLNQTAHGRLRRPRSAG
jgi:hypothetical protein